MIQMVKLLQVVSKDTGIPKEEVRKILDSSFKHIEKFTSYGEEVSITGFGKFKAKIYIPRLLKERVGRRVFGKEGKISDGRVVVKFHHYDSRRRWLWEESAHSKAFKRSK